MKTARPLLVVVLFLGIWIGWRSLHVSHSNEPSVSRAEFRPSAPAKIMKSATTTTPPIISEPDLASDTPTNRTWREKLMSEDTDGLKLSREELAGYLQANRTNAESLLIAWQASGDREFLRLAATNFPNDPFVQYSVVAHDVFPEDRREWLERFKQSDPNNSLANYLSARDLLKEGKTELALQELVAASGKTFNDYTKEKTVGLEEAYLQAGRSVAESKAMAMSSVMLPSLAPMKELGRQMSELQQQYVQSGDQASADAMVRMGVGLARTLDSGPASQTLINHLVSMAIERATLTKLDGEREFDFLGGTVAQRINELKAEREQIRPITAGLQNWLLGASDTEVIAYFNRLNTYGELSAMKWLKQRQPAQP
jgi:hypothetical protein